jgi:hypothetical protein
MIIRGEEAIHSSDDRWLKNLWRIVDPILEWCRRFAVIPGKDRARLGDVQGECGGDDHAICGKQQLYVNQLIFFDSRIKYFRKGKQG